MTQEEFLFGENGDTHRTMLWLALGLTSASALPVIEFGAGHSSTNYLKHFCGDNGRKFYTYDNNQMWAEMWGAKLITDWLDPKLYVESSVVLVDQGPAEDRHHSAWMFKDKAQIVVVHDVEPENSHSYKMDKVMDLFKYRIFTRGPKIWTVAFSNKINLNKHIGELIGNFKIEE